MSLIVLEYMRLIAKTFCGILRDVQLQCNYKHFPLLAICESSGNCVDGHVQHPCGNMVLGVWNH